MDYIGSIIKKFREDKGLSYVHLGRGLYSEAYIAGIESGRFKPSPQALREIARSLDEDLTVFVPYFLMTNPSPVVVIELAEELLKEDEFSGSWNLVNRVIQDSRVKRNKGVLGKGEYVLGKVASRRGEYGKARVLLTSALSSFRLTKGWINAAKVELSLAVLSSFEQEFLTSLRHLYYAQSYLDMANRKPVDLKVDILRFTGDILRRQGHIELAYENYVQAESVADRVKDYNVRAALEMGRALAAQILGKHSEAIEANTKALYCYYRLGNVEGMSDVYNNLGILLLEIGDRRAIRCLHKSLELAPRERPDWKKGYTKNELAIIYSNQLDYTKALTYLNQAVEHLEASRYVDELALSYELLGDTYVIINSLEEATIYYEKAKSTYREQKRKANVVEKLANIYFRQGKYEVAVEQYRETIEYLRS